MALWLVEFLQTPQYSVAAVCGYYRDININIINEGRELRKVRRHRDRRVKVVLSLRRKTWCQSSQILLQGGHQFWSCHQVGGLLSCGKEVLGDPGLLLAHLLSSGHPGGGALGQTGGIGLQRALFPLEQVIFWLKLC